MSDTSIKNLFSSTRLSKDEIAELLRTSPQALKAFEDSYHVAAAEFNHSSGNIFDHPLPERKKGAGGAPEQDLDQIVDRIVAELLSEVNPSLEDQNRSQVTSSDLEAIPAEIRPQLSGNLYKIDCDPHSSDSILWFYAQMLKEEDPEKKQQLYYRFRQGLDLLDLDPLMYAMLGQNRNSMGHWFPAVKAAIDRQTFFKVPETKIIRVPLPILQLSRIGYETLTPTTLRIVDEFCIKAFNLDVTKSYFVKTGTWSSKFNFRNAKVTGEKEVRELGEYLLLLSSQAVEMAGPLSSPCIYGASTTNEWVVREYIEDVEDNPCIYNGMPLHTEYRIFVDFDSKEILGISPYWRSDVMLKRFGEDANPNSPHDKHDYVIYKMHEPVLYRRYEENRDRVVEAMETMLHDVDLEGQWSVDIMQNGDDFYLIDMAAASTSALSDVVPPEKLKKTEENWLPDFQERTQLLDSEE